MIDPIYYTLSLVLAKRDNSAIKKIESLLPAAVHTRILSESKAVEWDFPNTAFTHIRDTISRELPKSGILADYAIQPTENRRAALLVCDMDSTLIGQECIDELADYAGVKDEVSEITMAAMQDDIDFETALIERVKLIKDIPISILQQCYNERIRLNPGAQILGHTMTAKGAKTVILSGGFTFFTSRIAALAGFSEHQANELYHDGDKLLGTVRQPILGAKAKQVALQYYAPYPPNPRNKVIAIGDGPMTFIC